MFLLFLLISNVISDVSIQIKINKNQNQFRFFEISPMIPRYDVNFKESEASGFSVLVTVRMDDPILFSCFDVSASKIYLTAKANGSNAMYGIIGDSVMPIPLPTGTNNSIFSVLFSNLTVLAPPNSFFTLDASFYFSFALDSKYSISLLYNYTYCNLFFNTSVISTGSVNSFYLFSSSSLLFFVSFCLPGMESVGFLCRTCFGNSISLRVINSSYVLNSESLAAQIVFDSIYSYQSSICVSCPAGLVSNSFRTVCVCPTTTIQLSNDLEIVSNQIKLVENSLVSIYVPIIPTLYCVDCPVGFNCSQSNTTFENSLLLEGYWRSSFSAQIAYQCLNSNACVGGGCILNNCCAYGYTGILCASCISNFYPIDNLCSPCPASLEIFGVIKILVCLVLMTLLLFMFIAIVVESRKCACNSLLEEMHSEIAKDEASLDSINALLRMLKNSPVRESEEISSNGSSDYDNISEMQYILPVPSALIEKTIGSLELEDSPDVELPSYIPTPNNFINNSNNFILEPNLPAECKNEVESWTDLNHHVNLPLPSGKSTLKVDNNLDSIHAEAIQPISKSNTFVASPESIITSDTLDLKKKKGRSTADTNAVRSTPSIGTKINNSYQKSFIQKSIISQMTKIKRLKDVPTSVMLEYLSRASDVRAGFIDKKCLNNEVSEYILPPLADVRLLQDSSSESSDDDEEDDDYFDVDENNNVFVKQVSANNSASLKRVSSLSKNIKVSSQITSPNEAPVGSIQLSNISDLSSDILNVFEVNKIEEQPQVSLQDNAMQQVENAIEHELLQFMKPTQADSSNSLFPVRHLFIYAFLLTTIRRTKLFIPPWFDIFVSYFDFPKIISTSSLFLCDVGLINSYILISVFGSILFLVSFLTIFLFYIHCINYSLSVENAILRSRILALGIQIQFLLIYPFVNLFVNFVDCLEVDGLYLMRTDASVICYRGYHVSILVYCIFVFLSWVALVIYESHILMEWSGTMKGSEFRAMTGHIISVYSDEWLLFDLIAISVRLSLIFLWYLLSDVVLVTQICSLILVFYIILILIGDPYRNKSHDFLDVVTSSQLLILTLGSSFLKEEDHADSLLNVYGGILVSMILLTLIYGVFVLVWNVWCLIPSDMREMLIFKFKNIFLFWLKAYKYVGEMTTYIEKPFLYYTK